MTLNGSTPGRTNHWVSSLVDRNPLPWSDSPVVSSVLWFGTIPNGTFVVFVLGRLEQIPADFLLAISLAVLWLNVGPLLIWYYDVRVLPTFFDEITDIVRDDERVAALDRKYTRLFAERYWIPTAAWTLLLVAMFFRGQSYLVDRGLFAVVDIYYVSFLIAVVYLGVFSGIGFMGVATTVLCIREIASEPIEIDPLYPDGLAGLSRFGYFAIRTTVTFSSGSLLLPLAFVFVRTGAVDFLAHLIVASYMLAIAVSFLYPTYRINRQARRVRDGIVDDLRHEYDQAKRELRSVGGLHAQLRSARDPAPSDGAAEAVRLNGGALEDRAELVGQLELQRIRNEYQDLQNVRLYPFKIDILVRLVSSILLPLVFLVIEVYVTL